MAMPRPEKPVPTIATSCSILLFPFLQQIAVVEIPGMEADPEILEIDRDHLAQRARADEVPCPECPPLARRPLHAVYAHQANLMIEHQRPENDRSVDHRAHALQVGAADLFVYVERDRFVLVFLGRMPAPERRHHRMRAFEDL